MPASLPSIALVTPSFNQGQFLEATLRSIHDQQYPRLEHVVMDGGSTDGSVDVIRRYAERLAYWQSTRDGGQGDALNKGFAHTHGEIMGWLNSDDLQFPWTLAVVGEIFALFPQVQWISSLNPVIWNRSGQAVGAGSLEGFSRGSFMRGGNIAGQPWFARGWIQQESTFWRRSLWEQAGGAVALELAFDFDLWARFYQHADLYGVRALLGGIRRHGEQKTARLHDQYVREVVAILSRHGGRPYSASASSLRHLARRLQQKPATRRRPLNALLAATGLMLPARNIVFNEETETWEIRERLVV